MGPGWVAVVNGLWRVDPGLTVANGSRMSCGEWV